MSKSKSLRCTYVKLNIKTHMQIADEYIHFETNDSNCFISVNSLEAYTTVFFSFLFLSQNSSKNSGTICLVSVLMNRFFCRCL